MALALRLHLYKSFASHSRQQGSEYNVGNCFQLNQNTNQAFSRHLYQAQAETQIKSVFILVRKQEHLVYLSYRRTLKWKVGVSHHTPRIALSLLMSVPCLLGKFGFYPIWCCTSISWVSVLDPHSCNALTHFMCKRVRGSLYESKKDTVTFAWVTVKVARMV